MIETLSSSNKNIFDNDKQALSVKRHDSIDLKKVVYWYSDTSRQVLKNVNISIPSKKTTVIVGASGSGKSTLLDMLAGLITPKEGQVLVGGDPLGHHNMLDWRRSLGYVSQTPLFFYGSLKENLCLGRPDISENQIYKAIEQAAFSHSFQKMADGLSSIIGPTGLSFSGGEAQRLSIARAILREPRVLLLDEPTSSLDNQSEKAIISLLNHLKGHYTIVLVTHRFEVAKTADVIHVMADGEIKESGSFEQLIAKNGYFVNLYDSVIRK